jgi:hypothetical protein
MGWDMSIVEKNSLRATPDGFAIGLRLDWYRSLPLSCLENLEINIDGQPVDKKDMTFEINDHLYSLPELEDKIYEQWFVQDTAWVNVHRPGSVKPGEEHTVDVVLAMRRPYMVTGPGKCLVLTSKRTETQVAAGVK